MNSKYLDILQQYWGYDSFRGIQEEIITSIGEGRDTMGLMPTGGGKSICFQVPALVMDGVCLVVTPLIALMKDQVQKLKIRGIRAEAIYSGMRRDDIVRVLDNTVLGGVKFLYISPERLGTELFLAKLKRMQNICMIVVDEAHCISQWGYDFRPSYLKVSEIRQYKQEVPILALTATATPEVIEDIQLQLRFRERRVYKMSFERKNLIYVVRYTHNKLEEMLHIIRSIPQGSVIVYVRSRRDTSELAQYIKSEGITSVSYHAGLTDAEKDFRQRNWTNNRVRVMVATNAFGMGIDKPDVRLVIHYNSPDSLEAYFQEAGRAGRDGMTSYAVLLCAKEDSKVLKQRVSQTYPPIDYVKKTYEDMCCFLQVGVGEAEGRTFDFNRSMFCHFFRHFETHADSALKLLSNAQYIDYCAEHNFRSSIHFILEKEELYRLGGQSKEADELMRAILRNYTGVFSEFVYIEESLLSHITGLSVEVIYEHLKEWNRNRIIDYIPHRNTPTITFIRKRVETEMLSLAPSVYLNRKADYEKRINKMVQYFTSKDTCRSKMLLEYFGEENVCDCGHCDVCLTFVRQNEGCLAKHTSGECSLGNVELVTKNILDLLSDRLKHSTEELTKLPYSTESIDKAISLLLNEDKIKTNGIIVELK